MTTGDDSLRRLIALIRAAELDGRWDLVDGWVHDGLRQYRDSDDPDLKNLCISAARWHLRVAQDVRTLTCALEAALQDLGADVDLRLEVGVGNALLLLANRMSAGYVQVAGWLRSDEVGRSDLALVVLEQAGDWSPRNAVVPVVEAASQLDLGNITDAQVLLERARALGASEESVSAVEQRMCRMLGQERDDKVTIDFNFGPKGHREKMYATAEFLLRQGRHGEALAIATKLDAEASTQRSRHYMREAKKQRSMSSPDVA